jgi:asparagine synthetase B (glutamine-hydrolysing)
MGWGKDGSLWFASEMKALIADCTKIQWFPPGFYYTKEKGFQPYYKPLYHNLDVWMFVYYGSQLLLSSFFDLIRLLSVHLLLF